MRCLGKKPARHDTRTLRLRSLLDVAALPAAPPAIDWSANLPDDLGTMANDRIGDCTCAGAAHMIQTWTAAHPDGAGLTLSDDQVVAAYSAISGYTPSDPTTDQGAALLDVLNYWRRTGFGNHLIGAYALVDHTNVAEVRAALDLFGGLYTGAQLPKDAENQIGDTWAPTDGPDGVPGSLGGHCLAAVAYDPDAITYVTWGKRQRATWDWFGQYADEVYALISVDWVSGATPAPSGFDVDALRMYLMELV